MVKEVKIIIAIVLIGVAAFVAFNYFSDEKKIMRRLDGLSGFISKEEGEPALTMAQKMKGVGSVFSETCLFEFDGRNISRNFRSDEITSYTTAARIKFSNLSLKFYDITVTVKDGNMANVSLTAIASGMTSGGEIFDETHEIEFELVKVDNEWFLRRIRAIEVLKK